MKKALHDAIKEGLDIAAQREKDRVEASKMWDQLEKERKQKQVEAATKWFEENESSFYADIKEAVGNGLDSVLYLEHELKLPKTFTLKDLYSIIGSTPGLFCQYLPEEYCDGPGDDNYNRIKLTWLIPKK